MKIITALCPWYHSPQRFECYADSVAGGFALLQHRDQPYWIEPAAGGGYEKVYGPAQAFPYDPQRGEVIHPAVGADGQPWNSQKQEPEGRRVPLLILDGEPHRYYLSADSSELLVVSPEWESTLDLQAEDPTWDSSSHQPLSPIQRGYFEITRELAEDLDEWHDEDSLAWSH